MTPSKRGKRTAPIGVGAVVGGTDPCVCGHAPEEHGHNVRYPSSTACTECADCIAYEADPDEAGK